jgi:hypothetical protein
VIIFGVGLLVMGLGVSLNAFYSQDRWVNIAGKSLLLTLIGIFIQLVGTLVLFYETRWKKLDTEKPKNISPRVP